ncbi:MAG: hypothetical protein KDK66_07395 [Deltaproteobacteria bacterium]|nr:hypothetical protein [Deltaproteobacteria bacterium]
MKSHVLILLALLILSPLRLKASPEEAVRFESLANQLCITAAQCDSLTTYNDCAESMGSVTTDQVLDELGLEEGISLNIKQVYAGIYDDTIVMNHEAWEACMTELENMEDTCLAEGPNEFLGGDYENLENLIDDDSPCESLLSI